jgi:PAS domain S-box-containing protein
MSTERSAHEREIERLNRLYAALSQVSQAIVASATPAELFERVCAALVEHGGLRMAWIGWDDPATRQLVPVASAGDDGAYLQRVKVYTDDRPEGRGPSGTAFRDGRHYLCNDLAVDPGTLPWREEFERWGFRASAVFPIRQGGEVGGTLNVYADVAGYFQDKEIALLDEAAVDVSFGLDNLARLAERARIEAIAERESRFASGLIEAMPGIFYLYNEAGRFLRWNRNFEAVSGYTGDEIRQMHPLDFFTGDDRRSVAQRIAEAFAMGESSVEAPFVTRDGSATPHFFTGRRIVFDGSTCLLGVGVDISERRRAEEAVRRSEARYRTTLDSILESCQLIDFDWRYLYLNDAAAVQNRRPNAELLGQRMPEVWPGIESSEVFALLRRCMETRGAVHEETPFAFPDGSSGWFDVRVQPVREGIFVLSIDITQRKRAERELRELNEQLERKVAERTADLEAARERAESADRLKSAFLATMSHELRTPLNSILGFTGIILQGLAGPLNPEQSKQLGMVQGSARHLLDLINDVLDLSRIEAGQMEVRPAPFDLRASIERVAGSVRPLAERKGITLGPIESDRRRVEQVLLNLLNNAIKFTDRGGVTLTAEVVAGGSDGGPGATARVRVRDTGIGMRGDDLATLFRPFRQLDTGLGRQHEGTGLGLAICRRLTDLLGGTVSAQSVWGEGSVFTVSLPLGPSGESSA